ncbi:FliC/FljB family flagellin [Salinicola sp. LHM]|uniref:FliC/FljB family flagellin n=1 Tax=Salinicola sp. LHM TaxID=3065298 RepID=UPI002ACD383E|nr:FliC/FljB family flagellin [Salinicola sp. LHM]WQH34873.1 FliC/FljB family flagellin [Salinicola sp. LHM]
MAVINTNITSLIGQQNLNKSQSSLQTAMERLSSGSRINSAKDDAAGQAIANRMTSQITGLTQAQRNANDGISVAQTAEGALNQINDNLQRVRELTVQAQNGTNSASDLESIQNEISQRLGEIDRISEQTDFNGTKVLDGSKTTIDIQVGADDNQVISINLKKMDSTSLELGTFSVAKGINTSAVAASAITTTATGSSSVALTSSVASGFTKPSADTTSAGSFGSFYTDGSGNYYVQYTGDASAAGGSADGYYAVNVSSAGVVSLGALQSSVTSAGLTSTSTATYSGSTTSTSLSGADVDAGNVFAYSGTEEGAPEYVIKDSSGSSGPVYYEAVIADDGSVTRGGKLATQLPTDDPLAALDKALSKVDDLRSDLGAIQNRFDSAITNLSTSTTNLSAARSRIEDADYAVEVSNMTRAQILQQAGTSVLAQANQVPQSVLSLLG